MTSRGMPWQQWAIPCLKHTLASLRSISLLSAAIDPDNKTHPSVGRMTAAVELAVMELHEKEEAEDGSQA